MIVHKIKNTLRQHAINIRGRRTPRNIVIIESDDWGTIRMAGKTEFEFLKKKGLPVDLCPYNSYDRLESDEDLEFLFDVLSSVQDSMGNPAILTANNIVANPNFKAIKESEFEAYYYEPFTTTLERYPNSANVLELYRQGIESKLICPQFHGREHVNVNRWLKALKNNTGYSLLAFELNMFSVREKVSPAYLMEFMDAFDCDSKEQLEDQKQILKDGLNIFKEIWGYDSESFIAPCYTWSSLLNPILLENGVKLFQGNYYQLEPILSPDFQYKKKIHYQGQRNEIGQFYSIRNVVFEPALDSNRDWVDSALKEISLAFKYKKAAVISTHRLNYIGSIVPENRDRNLRLLGQLLAQISRRWPSIEFMSSNSLLKEFN